AADLTGNARVQLGTVDIGAEEASNSQAAVQLTASPASLTTCIGSAGTFTVTGATLAGTNFNWEFNTGAGWQPFVYNGGTWTGPQDGTYNIQVVNNSSTLVAMNIA